MPVVTCSHNHRFAVNLKKHTDRNYVFCPKCREKVIVQKVFNPNPEWDQEKENRLQQRLMIKAMKKRPDVAPLPQLPLLPARAQGVLPVLIAPVLLRRLVEEEKEENGE